MRAACLFLLWCAVALGDTTPVAITRYEIDLSRVSSHLLLVSVEADCPKADCDFQMPVWNALYQVRDFAQFVNHFEATGAGGDRLPHRLLSPSSWRVEATPGERVRLRYQYYADAPGPFGSSASARHLFVNFAQVLLYPVSGRQGPMSVKFGNLSAGWKIALELPQQNGAFQAQNYDALADAPAEISAFRESDFLLAGKRMRVVVDGDPKDYDLELITNTAHRVASAAVEIMRDAPFPSYTFIYHFQRGGRGGMEHANSCAIDASAPCRNCTLAGVTAHEFFHLWNVKRIRPQSLEPIDYTRENITPSLWFSEGVTSTMAAYLQLQAGLLDRVEFLNRLENQITAYEQTAARLTQSAEEASIAAWLERYPFYEKGSRSVSYYLKGELAGYLLDLTIRHDSGNRRGLDDLMRRLNADYAAKGKFFNDTEGLERVASEVAGRNLREFFDAVIRRPAPIEWDRYLGYAGYQLVSTYTSRATLGAETERRGGSSVVVSDIAPGSPGERAGLEEGDRIISLDHRPVRRSLEEELESSPPKPGSRIQLEVERNGRRLTFEGFPEFVRQVGYKIQGIPNASPAQRLLQAAWLRQVSRP